MAANFTPGTSSDPCCEVELTVSCRNLRDMDFFSKSDPMCVVYTKNQGTDFWQEIKRTEIIMNNLNPDFTTKIEMEYRFEESQYLKFEVYDIDTKNVTNLKEHDFIGQCVTTLGQIVSNRKLQVPLSKGLSSGTITGEIIITAEELTKCRDEVTLKFSARDLLRKSWRAWCDPFFEIFKINENCENTLVYRSEVAKRTYQPIWKAFTLPVRTLCGNDLDRNIKVVCQDSGWLGNHRVIGECYVTLRQISQGPGSETVFSFTHPRKQRSNPNYRNSGTLVLEDYKLQKVYSFLDYVFSGMQIHCTVAIDFTASNGNPNFPESLHYISSVPNPYEQALTAVVEILQDYDSDKLFPVLGFGARLPPDGHVSHEFFVNLDQSNPYCAGVEGVLEAYKFCINEIQLFGPTNFSPVINHVANYARRYQDGTQYFILLIITDGVITDMPQTKQAIIAASTLPMSLIIIGVGNADFAAMDELDADVVPLTYNGITASRDIVQFVPFRNFQKMSNIRLAKAYLAKEVLAEIPDQVVGFMKSRNIAPPPRQPDERNIGLAPTSPPPYTES